MTKEEEEMEADVDEILRHAKIGLNEDSIVAIMLLNRQIYVNESLINSLLSGSVWAEYKGDRIKEDKEEMDLDLFELHLTELYPRNEEIYRFQPKKD